MTAAILAPQQRLIDCGLTLATVADPDKDLLSFAGSIGEVEIDLKHAAAKLDHAYDRAAVSCAADQRVIERHALAEAKRSLQQALISVAQIIGEVELAQQRAG